MGTRLLAVIGAAKNLAIDAIERVLPFGQTAVAKPPVSSNAGAAYALRRTEPSMITRMWRGWTRLEHADAYQRFLLENLFPSMRTIPGFVGADVLRRPDGTEAAFVTLTRFESLGDVSAFAGKDYEVPVLAPEALELLSRYDARALHFETAPFVLP
jgi:hypothetical protein